MDDQLVWNPDGHCTEAYEDWFWIRSDAQTFLNLSMQWSTEGFQRIRNEAAALADAAGRDRRKTFYELVNELTPTDYLELLCSLVLQRIVSGFDIYHESAIAELGRRHGFYLAPESRHFDSPSWGQVVKVYREALNIEIDPVDIRNIRTLRHRLTHQAGELRRTEDQLIHGEGRTTEYRPQQARVDPGLVKSHSRTLDANIQRIDQIMWRLTYLDDNEGAAGHARVTFQLFLKVLEEQQL
jgi:hypothetical protein